MAALRTAEISAIDRWLQGFVQHALQPDEVDTFVRSVDDEIIRAIPEIAGDPALIEELHASTRAHWRSFLVVGLTEEYRLALPPAAVALSLSIARRHLDISVLLKVYRVANKSTFRYLIAHTDPDLLPDGLTRDEALLTLWERAEAWIDDSVEALIVHFTQERAALTEGTQARRGEIIESLLAGAAPTPVMERMLGHRFGSWQTAFVISAPAGTEELEGGFFDLAVRACGLLGLPHPLTWLAGSRELWGWAATIERPDVDISETAALMADAGVHLALGGPAQGTGAFRTSHLQAIAAQRVGLEAPGMCHSYADVEVVSLLGTGELATALVAREVGPLLGRAKGQAALRETALTYLCAAQNVEATAAALFVHPNTVRYRLGRIEEHLGCRLADRAAVLELCLRWLDVHGGAALG